MKTFNYKGLKIKAASKKDAMSTIISGKDNFKLSKEELNQLNNNNFKCTFYYLIAEDKDNARLKLLYNRGGVIQICCVTKNIFNKKPFTFRIETFNEDADELTMIENSLSLFDGESKRYSSIEEVLSAFSKVENKMKSIEKQVKDIEKDIKKEVSKY